MNRSNNKYWVRSGKPIALPPVGTVVTSVNHSGEGPVLATWVSTKGEPKVCWSNGVSDYEGTPLEYIRPVKTEREKLIERAIKDSDANIDCMDIVIESLIDAGWRPSDE